MKFVTIPTIVYILCIVKNLECARILAVLPVPCYSHQIVFTRLWLELHKRGHEIVLATANPIATLNLTNITQIDIEGSQHMREDFDFVRLRFEGISWLTFMKYNENIVIQTFAESVLDNPRMKKLYAADSNETFDVVMLEMISVSALLGLVHRFNAPLIGLSSVKIPVFEEHALGGLVLPSHEATWQSGFNIGPNLSFWSRVRNFVRVWYNVYFSYSDLEPRQENLAKKYFETPLPPLSDILKNMSLLFVNQDDVLTPAKLKLPNLIPFNSFHISNNLTPLPTELKRFLDSATNGFIYFNLGTNVWISSLPSETIQIFLDVFAKLPYKVLWKVETELPGKPDNVFTAKWFTQQSVLAHRNIKLLMYQGGSQSSQEAVHFAVPVLGLPVLGDQDYQARRMEALGVGKYLEIVTLTRDNLECAIREIITDKKYKERMLRIRDLREDRPYDMAEHLVWWTEFVIRHKGAPHLHSSVIWQPWYQRYDIDIVIFLTIVACIGFSSALCVIVRIVLFVWVRRQVLCTSQKLKKS